MVLAGAASIATGKDANWDLKNYHWYNAWALLHGRLGFDLAPAQVQTYYNPVGDLPFHFLVHALPWPRHVAFWMALPAAVAAFFLLRMLALLWPPRLARTHGVWLLAAAAIGVTGATGRATIGSTMNEWLCAAFVIAALWIALRALVEGEERHRRAFAAGALLVGCAAGLKLTYAIFAVGYLVALATFGPWRERAARLALAGAAMLAGFALFGGYWAWVMWREFGNPVFPYYNHVFHSPWWEDRAFFDTNWGPRSALQWLLFPFYIVRQNLLASEVAFRDYRLAALQALGVLALAWRMARGAPVPVPWRFLAAFTLASYVVWLKLFGIYRYLLPLELLSGPLVVGCLLYVLPRTAWRLAAVGVLTGLLIGSTRPADWGRIPFGRAYFENTAPALAPNALVIVGYVHPYAYEIPFFRSDARFVSPANNFLQPGQANLLARRIDEVIRTHAGPIYLLEMKARLEQDRRTLAFFGLEFAPEPCLALRTPMADNYEQACRLRRLSPA